MPLALRPVKRGRGPAHAQIETALAEAIEGLEPGTRLPSERDLARRARVSRMTVRHALDSLERRGLLARRVGRGGGTFVADAKLELAGLAALSDQLRALGLTAGAHVLSARKVAAPAELATDGAYEIVRVRLADGEPVALERTWVPADVFPGLIEHRLDGSLYALLREHYDEVPVRAVERLEPTVATRAEAAALGVAARTPLMAVERLAYGESGRPLELSHDRFRGDRVRVVWSTPLT